MALASFSRWLAALVVQFSLWPISEVAARLIEVRSMGHTAAVRLLGNDVRTRRTTEPPVACLAPPLLYAEVRGVRVPKQTSAEAMNGKLVSS
jgi:hypothetical protein